MLLLGWVLGVLNRGHGLLGILRKLRREQVLECFVNVFLVVDVSGSHKDWCDIGQHFGLVFARDRADVEARALFDDNASHAQIDFGFFCQQLCGFFGILQRPLGTGSDLDADADAVTALLESRGLLSNQAAAELNAFMQDAGTDSQLVQLLLGLELQSLVGQAAGIQANIDATERQRAEYAAAAAERRAAIAELAQERTELERDLRVAEGLYTNSLNLEPVLTYVSDVLETNVRVLDEASVPMSPASGGRLLITVIAFVVGGLLATVFVFLRAAVMPEPTPVRRPAPEAV